MSTSIKGTHSFPQSSDETEEFRSEMGQRTDDSESEGGNFLENAQERAEGMAETIREGASNTVDQVAAGMKSLAETMETRGPSAGAIGDANSAVAVALREGGEYLQREGLEGMAEDLTEVVRRYPMTAVLLGVGVGFLLARSGR